MPELRRPIVAVCMYMRSSFKRDAARPPPAFCRGPPAARRLLPVACRLLSAGGRPPPAACFLLSAVCRPLPAACRLSGRLPPPAGSRGGRRCLAFLALRHPHCSRLLPAVPASSCCSRLFRVVPPPLPRAGTPRKSNGASFVRMRRRWGICLPLFGEFPGSPASVGLGPQP